MELRFKRKVPIPQSLKEEYPMTKDLIFVKEKRDLEIAQIFTGVSDKHLLIIGPCSADREDSVLDYVSRLAKVQEKVKDKMLIVPRVYTNKSRTLCDGYLGMLYQPDVRKNEDIFEGIIAVRKLHLKVVQETGLTAADEMLYPDDYRYISDIVSYIAIGARSVENQLHRLTASGLSIPVGFKNPTSGDINIMLNSISAAQQGHTFLYRGWEVHSDGNALAHSVLRGYTSSAGKSVPNYYYENLEELLELYSHRNLKNMSLIVDVNHSNSNKKPLEQIRICKEVLGYNKYSAGIKQMIKGFMIESYIEDGNQPLSGNVYGKSITDPCLGWEKTERLIYDIADSL